MNNFADKICFVTYKEVMIFWNITASSAVQRLNTIRKSLGKTKFHRLTVNQFCKAEDITVDEFSTAINNHYNQAGKRA